MREFKANDNKIITGLERPYYDCLRPIAEVMEEDRRRHCQSIVKVGDIVELIDGRGFMRVDEIAGDEIRMRIGRGVSWCSKSLINRIGKFVEVERL